MWYDNEIVLITAFFRFSWPRATKTVSYFLTVCNFGGHGRGWSSSTTVGKIKKIASLYDIYKKIRMEALITGTEPMWRSVNL